MTTTLTIAMMKMPMRCSCPHNHASLSHNHVSLSSFFLSPFFRRHTSETFMESPPGKNTWKLTVEWTPVHPDKLSMSVG